MITRAFWMGLAVSATLLAASGLKADDRNELKKFQGTWVSKGPADGDDESRWVFDGKDLKVTSPKRSYDATIMLVPDTNPRAIDLKINSAPEDAKGKTSLGIYKFDADNDSLTICLGGADNYRPEKFEQEDRKSYLFHLKLKK